MPKPGISPENDFFEKKCNAGNKAFTISITNNGGPPSLHDSRHTYKPVTAVVPECPLSFLKTDFAQT